VLASADATLTIAGVGCGQSFAESEPNDDVLPPWAAEDDFGIVLASGCVVTIDGFSGGPGGTRDTFKFNAGSAARVILLLEWSTGTNELDSDLYDNLGTKVLDANTTVPDLESGLWIVGAANADLYIDTEQRGVGGIPYTVTIEAD
jgi:hypothetical protein